MEIARNNLNSTWMEVLSIKMCQILHIQTPTAIKHTKRDKRLPLAISVSNTTDMMNFIDWG